MAASIRADERTTLVADLLEELRRRAESAADPRPVRCVETHVSWVLLGPEVYKIKKPVAFPFLDFGSFDAREQACRVEVRINRRLAPSVYLGVAPVRRRPDGRYSFDPVGVVVDSAVWMRRLDEARRADVLLGAGQLAGEKIDLLADVIARFHASSPSTPAVARRGLPEHVLRHVRDNFAALRPHADALLPAHALEDLERWQVAFVHGHVDRFEARMRAGAIRDGHGDLRLEHVFLREGGEGFDVIDGIEFSEEYRFADRCADVAFLAMDLARLGRADLAERFVARYARASNDFDLYGVLDFYESYRACIRAKVALLGPDGPERARPYLLVADGARRRTILPPALVVVAGGIASGKSSIAERLADEIGAPIVDADRTRKHLLGVEPTEHACAPAWQGAYDPLFTERVYAEVLRRADVVLASGRPVVVDASFRSAALRARARGLASAHNVPFRLVECVAPAATCAARVARRRPQESVSDATPELVETFLASFEAVNASELCPLEHVRIDTGGPLARALDAARTVVATWPRGLVG